MLHYKSLFELGPCLSTYSPYQAQLEHVKTKFIWLLPIPRYRRFQIRDIFTDQILCYYTLSTQTFVSFRRISPLLLKYLTILISTEPHTIHLISGYKKW